MKKLITFALWTMSFMFGQGAYCVEKIDEIEQFEIRSYSPVANGVSDLVFEARIENLTELLNKNLAIGKLVDVHFKVYWISPTQYQIEVMGLKKGFKEIRDDLSSLIKGKLEFVIPEKFSDKFKNYNLKIEPFGDGKLIRAIDETYTLSVSEVAIVFDKNGGLKSVETKSPTSKILTEFEHSVKSWSKNKLVLDKTIMNSRQGAIDLRIENIIDYKNIQGFGFPASITIKNLSTQTIPATAKDKEKKVKQETLSKVLFSKYEINTGKARKKIYAN